MPGGKQDEFNGKEHVRGRLQYMNILLIVIIMSPPVKEPQGWAAIQTADT